jgi:hypothetical protein
MITQAKSADSNGLVFTPVRTPYTPGKGYTAARLYLFLTKHRLQWKFPEFNVASFKLNAQWDQERKVHFQLQIVERQTIHKYFDDITLDPEIFKKWKADGIPDGKIMDCRFDPEWDTYLWEGGYAPKKRKGGWRFVRLRYHQSFLPRPDRHIADEEKNLKLNWKSLISPVSIEMVSFDN